MGQLWVLMVMGMWLLMRGLNNFGFTLMEMLMVMFIVSIIMGVLMIGEHSIYRDDAFNRFYENFQNDIYLAQMCAYNNNTNSEIVIDNEFYIVSCDGYEKKYTYDANCTIATNFPDNTIKFNENGNINQAGTINMCMSGECYDIVFNLGNGRFYVEE
jgi:competence protein ComGD